MPRLQTHRALLRPLIAGMLLVLAASACTKQYFPIPQPKPTGERTSERTSEACLMPNEPVVGLENDPASKFPTAECVTTAWELVQQMSPEEKYGQMMQPDRAAVRDPLDVTRYGYGSILSGGGSGPPQNQPLAWARMVNEFRLASLKTPRRIPVLYGIDAVHGHNNVRDAVIFPHNIGLGASRDVDLVRRIGRATAEEVAGTNIDWTFAPVLAAAKDERWGRTYESFGEAAELAEALGPAMIVGLQTERLGSEHSSVLACAKHFVGDGSTEGGVDRGNAPLTMDQVRRELLPAYEKAIAAGVGSVMASFSSIDGVKMHCHGPLLTDTLKGSMGFRGFIVSDWEAVELLSGDYPLQLASAINAGVDMIMAPKVGAEFIQVMGRLVPDRISQRRVDDAVTRILAVKCQLGLFDQDHYRLDRSGKIRASQSLGSIGSSEHRALAREAVARSLVLLKNDGTLPLTAAAPIDATRPVLSPNRVPRVHLTGSHADDIGRQSGGWTISWQGSAGPITKGTTLKQAFEHRLKDRLSTSAAAPGGPDVDVNVLAIGEEPYAEGDGDDSELAIDSADMDLARALKAQGKPLVVILISGRPLILGELLDLANSFIVAWLPGSEGDGVSDVVFGDRGFTASLPHSWPRTIEQLPINVGDAAYQPLFPYGFGLRYADQDEPLTELTPLPLQGG